VSAPRLTLQSIESVAVEVPMKHVLGTSQAAVRAAPLLLIDVRTKEGVTGRAYLFCYLRAAARPIADFLAEIERIAKGEPIAPAEAWPKLARRFTLIGVQGVVRMALAGFDVACWDALARAAGQPLVRYVGVEPRPVRAYNSNGLGLMAPAALEAEALELLEGGFGGVKLRLGYATLEEDVAAVRAVRAVLPPAVELMVDYNQALTVDEALRRGRALEEFRLAWIEEPIRHDDYRGAARLARELTTPIQIGENFSLVHALREALAQEACDYVMPDLERIGGVTGWREAATVAAEARVPMSSHLFPEVSAHLLAATPTAHRLEYVDWAAPLLQQPLAIEAGMATASTRPGNGLEWNDEAVGRYRLA
jgi:mandelate racemase